MKAGAHAGAPAAAGRAMEMKHNAPDRRDAHAAALALIEQHGRTLLATARRYSARPADADDAYQLGLEILLTKAPPTEPDELLPWLRTVIKHEALALNRAAARHGGSEAADAVVDLRGATEEIAERRERLYRGGDAMARLKPAEARCLALKAEGLSYADICAATGFSYTKVNRCIAEGRRAFHAALARISAGAECERVTPLLSRLADGEASAEDLRTLRPHLRHCGTCRSTLREYRATPRRVAALLALPGMTLRHALAHVGARLRGTLARLRVGPGSAHLAGAGVAAVAALAAMSAAGSQLPGARHTGTAPSAASPALAAVRSPAPRARAAAAAAAAPQTATAVAPARRHTPTRPQTPQRPQRRRRHAQARRRRVQHDRRTTLTATTAAPAPRVTTATQSQATAAPPSEFGP